MPDLDDRSFADLVREAREVAARSCPDWTDMSVHDPGMVLIEAFAHVTDTFLYRVNRLPDKCHLTFLNLIGLTRRPPASAWADVVVSRVPNADPDVTVEIPAGTAVVSARGAQQVRFVLPEPVTLSAGTASVTVRAHHGELAVGELLGIGTGAPGQVFGVARAPITVTTEPIDLMVGVETTAERSGLRGAAREHEGRVFEIWQQVESFADAPAGVGAFQVDRADGLVRFAPDLGDPTVVVPSNGAQVRMWYRTGGGGSGNVGAGQLTTLEPAVDGVTVTNPEPARGGRDLETVDRARVRGPQEFFALNRAVTARDYEALATAGPGGIARARAFTRVSVRPFARPGEVEVVLVPDVPHQAWSEGRLALADLRAHEIPEARARTEAELQGRGALGTTCLTSWANYKEVAVSARVHVRPEEDAEAVGRRIRDRLNRTICPLPSDADQTGWRFGEALRASTVYRLLEHAEPGVRYVDEVTLTVTEAPDGLVPTVVADPTQPSTWFAGSGEVLFRSVNDGGGWEPTGRFPGEIVVCVAPAPRPVRPGMKARPGELAVATALAEGGGSRIQLSGDLGDTWTRVAELDARIHDLAWIEREGAGSLLVATDKGLFELPLIEGGAPRHVTVDAADPDLALYAVEAFVSPQGAWAVAVAAQAGKGVHLSVRGGEAGSFGNVGPAGAQAVDGRCLRVQLDGPATVLWLGAGEASPESPGKGCLRARMFEASVTWESLGTGWQGGTCWDVAFRGPHVVAASQSAGVLVLEHGAAQPQWTAPPVDCGLALRDKGRLQQVAAVAASETQVVAGGLSGVYRSTDLARWSATAHRVATDAVTVPDTWLLCSGEHRIEVVGGHAPGAD